MSKLLKWIGLLAIVLFVVMQFARPARVKRHVIPSQTIQAQTQMPPVVAAIVQRSCGDCHSEETHWRWYSNIAPISWLQMADVGMARDVINLSRWSNYTPEEQSERLKHMCEEVQSGDMPPWYYKPLHPGAWLSSGDVAHLCQWAQAERQRLTKAPPATPPSSQN